MLSSSMENTSYKQRSKTEKVQVGCMSGLISMFHFRRSPKFLSDGSRRFSRYSVRSDIKGSEDFNGIMAADSNKDHGIKAIHAGRASIKALMEEEMTSDTQPLKQTQKNTLVEFSNDVKSVNLHEGSEIDLNLAASLMEIYRSHNEGQDSIDSVGSGHNCDSIDQENNTGAGAHPNRIPSIIQKALEDLAEAVISHQSANAKYITSSGEARSKELVDALQLLSSNKELFLMLLQDPSSRLLQCLQNLYTSLGGPMLELAESDEETKLQGVSTCKMQRTHNSFLMEDKLVMRKPSKLNDSSRGLSRIVILKPSSTRSQSSLISSSVTSSPLSNNTNLQGQEESDKPAHHFSLRELRRRLRLATMNSTFEKADSLKQFPVESMSISSESTDSSDCEIAKQPSIVEKETNLEDSGNGMGNDATHDVGSFSYEKAKKHIIEKLQSQDEDSSQILCKSESFGRLISYPEYDTFSPSRCPQEEDTSILPEASDSLALQIIEQDAEPTIQHQETISADASVLANKQLDELGTDHGSHPFKEDTISQELTNEDVENKQDAVKKQQLCTEVENSCESLEQINSDPLCLEERHHANVLAEVPLYSPEEQNNRSPSAVIGLAKPSILTFACLSENADEKEEKLSPQSVLDSSLGSTSPSHKTRKQDELSMPSSRILFEELDTPSSPTLQNRPEISVLYDKYERVSFIKYVLEASELLADGSSERWYMNVLVLETSVLAEVGTSYCLTDDVVLLFDCVEEVLLRIRDNFFGADPWVAFLKHNVRPAPLGTELVKEVAKCIDSLVSTEFPKTLDQVVLKDLETGPWVDLRCDTESVVIEVWHGVLDDLMEEMIFDLWL
ncbi:uncharacterized protein LOC100844139 [Brachypodium distachyon]|uniref:DUF4378 domain-containing protein n=3 Tax=Brachypodium distachyon TaxID=15368 RepID=A0A0Q3H748_BRADI|nr:uncharacterized protein LOC100844139 [Brachypodium distachyon]KQJ84011.1 hypothetical protein BRADI_5g18150v3 [Brachypodium distachyon]|eukprot:XP_010240234.1 uncharacterized protein LOC100844139 [Brachypodium distachyon]